jgi:hypothetical protein
MSQTAFDPGGLLTQQIFGLPVDRDTLFANHKYVYKKRVEKRQRSLIVRLAFIRPFLRPDEKILLVTTGYSPVRDVANLITGWLFIYLKRSLFVFTNYRIFHIPATSTFKYRNSIAHIAYAACSAIILRRGTLIAEYRRSGKVEKFCGIAVAERKKIRSLLAKLPGRKTQDLQDERVYLCPRCTNPLQNDRYVCDNCQLSFKKKLTARILGIVFPGGGYFYTRNYFPAMITALLELGLLGVAGFVLHNGLPADTGDQAIAAGACMLWLILKTVGVVHASHFVKEFIPVNTQFETRPVARGRG